ncbi:MAG: SET domain-containing protein [Imperialibacter sp.]|uniref:SET domain-containing protein n=1 Tax=Imperialibacter sp. TaxID=2038411 RepID=UPI0032EB303C
MIHPHTELRLVNDTVGYGVFATEFIPEGTITYIRDSLELEITPEAFEKCVPLLQEKIERYSYIDQRGVRVVSWDLAKYVNHCCQCNTMSTGYGFEIAIRDIFPGEQITDEYGIFNMTERIDLLCDKPGCRGSVSADDFDAYYPKWDETLKQSLAKLKQVQQPLMPLMEEETVEQLESYFSNPANYLSVYSLKLEKETVRAR